MRPITFSTQPILHLLRRTKIATLDQLSAALGSSSSITVFRKLDQLHYRTSYSHRGRFYTLDRIARFDDNGLWSHDSVWFSRFGTLVDTAAAFVNRSPSGYFVAELDAALHVSVQDTLLQLVQQGRLARHQVSGLYLYCSADPALGQPQIQARQADITSTAAAARFLDSDSEVVKAGILLFYSLLNEQQRRLFAGLEALRQDNDRLIADLFGLDAHTVAKGRRELVNQQVLRGRLRRPGGGRKATEKKRRS
ncbi:MAG: hypothetical protein JNL98_11715 [Bryobacterales bacterium]|nr:hypothetical protein [Bryobacterales bacterium]